jgi:hypothetical protein
MRNVRFAISGRDEVGLSRLRERPFAMDRVEQSVIVELGVKPEADKPAFEPIVDRPRKRGRKIGIERRRLVIVQHV